MTAASPRFVPATGYRILTPLYDPVLRLTTREVTFRRLLMAQVAAWLPVGATAVDIGCGTGTFAIAMAHEAPVKEVIGVDLDPAILERARRKAGGAAVRWERGSATDLPLPDGCADRAVFSLVLHHLLPEAKRAALREAVRILKPNGQLHIADWGRPHDPLMRALFLALQTVDGFTNTRDHVAGRLPVLLTASGLVDVQTHTRLRTVWGTLELLSASKPHPAAPLRSWSATTTLPLGGA